MGVERTFNSKVLAITSCPNFSSPGSSSGFLEMSAKPGKKTAQPSDRNPSPAEVRKALDEIDRENAALVRSGAYPRPARVVGGEDSEKKKDSEKKGGDHSSDEEYPF